MTDSPVAPEVRAHIEDKLAEVEAGEGVRILLAIESGSRAWGFPSPDSDYDVRFVYRHEADWYLSLREERDVIERGIDERDIDLAGWDLRKALRLGLKWNPVLHEWLVSPVTYAAVDGFRDEALKLYLEFVDLRAIAHHYASQVRGQRRRNLGGGEIKLKTYFYVIRPLLSLQWVLRRHALPPMHMEALLAGSDLPGDVAEAIDRLIAMKRGTPELGSGAKIPVIDGWIEKVERDLDPAAAPRASNGAGARTAADALFRRILHTKI